MTNPPESNAGGCGYRLATTLSVQTIDFPDTTTVVRSQSSSSYLSGATNHQWDRNPTHPRVRFSSLADDPYEYTYIPTYSPPPRLPHLYEPNK